MFLGGIVAYSNEIKTEQLAVPASLIEEHGAVSSEVARAMAKGVADSLGASMGLSVTGIAGPTGGTEEKPIGTIYLAVYGPGIERTLNMVIPGGRTEVRARSTQAALNLLRLELRS